MEADSGVQTAEQDTSEDGIRLTQVHALHVLANAGLMEFEKTRFK